MTVRICVPCDAIALSIGADDVAVAITAEAATRGLDVSVVRTGSRGLFHLDPLVEVELDGVRHGYGPVGADDVTSLFDAGFATTALAPGAHPLALGPVEAIAELSGQTRLTFERHGVVDPRSLDDYLAHGGYEGLRAALAHGPEHVVTEVTTSGLRGRGGAAFPTGIKWRTVAEAPATPKYVVANADEGDSGTFADRMVMEGDPFCLIEGMTIAAFGVGATHGVVFIRSEYPQAIATMTAAIATARAAGWLGADVAGSGHSFDLEVRMGAGAYICGEETSMLECIEGKRGQVRAKPP
ncbi:MAG: formate dehydrogenase, partial [Actinomycetes bacterium]